MKNAIREEKDIFNDLTALCSKPGYAHAVAHFCFKHNVIRYGNKLKPKDLVHTYSMKKLVRTEISTLIGLMLKGNFDLDLPEPDRIQYLLDRTESLLEEMHNSLMAPLITDFDPLSESNNAFTPFASGLAMREPIFYSGESAYIFQYMDFSVMKYSNDEKWIKDHKNFTMEEARKVFNCIADIQNNKLMITVKGIKNLSPDKWTMLPAFVFNKYEIVDKTQLNICIIEKVLEAFILPEEMRNNECFNTLNDFNIINAYPIIKMNEDEYLLFQYYSLAEAFYETPFYWLSSDKNYCTVAMKNRGSFTEQFSKERLQDVFGKNKVFSNINIVNSKKNRAAEIDVLVVYGNRAIILQAKSKRLTLEARKGNDNVLKDDFKKSIQASYDQALICSKLITDQNYKLVDETSKEITIDRKFKEVYIFCVVSDHYPALSFQTLQFLNYEQTEIIMPPIVIDIFALDAISEMLNSPLQFLNYLNKRVLYYKMIVASEELTILSYHLQQDLRMDDRNYNLVLLEDDIAIDIDIAMMARRQGLPGKTTPKGILTRHKDTLIGNIVQTIEISGSSESIDLGLFLLQLSEEVVIQLCKGIEKIAKLARNDGKNHDFSVLLKNNTGITIHCNNESTDLAGPRLEQHCHLRKYLEKTTSWFGICVDPNSLTLRFGVVLDFEWEWSDIMQDVVRDISKTKRIKFRNKEMMGQKIGRNDLCPCGSGIKYKKCCLLS